MLVDVRNGYPYGTVQSTASDDGLATRIGSQERSKSLKEKVTAEAVAKLSGETGEMMRKLKPELAALDGRR